MSPSDAELLHGSSSVVSMPEPLAGALLLELAAIVYNHVSLTPFMLSILPIIPALCPVPRRPHYSHYYAAYSAPP